MFEPAGLGVTATFQADPSQPVTNVRLAPSRRAPTATQAEAETHETAANPEMNERLGLGRSDQPRSRRRTSVRLPWPRTRSPTAAHQSSATQATPVRLLKTPALGLRSSRHPLPSNDAAAVRTTSPLEC